MIKKRLSLSEKNYIREMVQSGLSLKNIANRTGKSKTTVYYYFRDIRGRTILPITINEEKSELVGEFLGIVAGDGCLNKTKQHHYRVYLFFNKKEHAYVRELYTALFYELFKKQPSLFDRKERDIFILYFCSKEIYFFVKRYLTWDMTTRKSHSVHLKSRNHTTRFKIGFLRGLIDSDGYLSNDRIVFSTSSMKLAADIMQFLDE